DHQDAARNTTAQALEFTRITEKFYEFAHFFLGFVATCNVGQCGLDLIFGEQTRLALAETHWSALASRATLHLAHEEHEDSNDDQDREAGDQQLGPDALLLRLFAFDHDIVVDQITDQAVVLDRRTNGLEGIAVAAFTRDDVTVNGNFLDLAILNLLDELGVVEGLRLVRAGEVVHHRHKDRGDDQP
nr:hypothetical protein [Tanacetum cinerariifolium]